MVYDEGLAELVREKLEDQVGYSEKKMFGGLCFMLHGNMICGIVKNQLMARVAKESYESVLQEPHVMEMDFTGRPLRGLIYIDEDGSNDEEVLEEWVRRSLENARTLPPK